uniref:Uncharacterized protein n=1 Tax=Globisporangium ultimum (strain ATCC 200006 / CBS 805.95 / DAOM BR144) TaxID=431595 RepID=K3X4V4_GLOUD
MQHASNRPTADSPSSASKQKLAIAAKTHDKHFTVRDGFHLKSRNDEKRRAIDHNLLPQHEQADEEDKADVYGATNAESATMETCGSGPHAAEIPVVAVGRRKLHSYPSIERFESSNNDGDDDAFADPSPRTASSQAARLVEASLAGDDTTIASTDANALSTRDQQPQSSDWLIYRQRENLTPRRREQRVEEMIQKVILTARDKEAHRVLSPTATKANETLAPTRPRQPSLSGSTYHQRVLTSRTTRSPRHLGLAPLSEHAPLTETERSLLVSREETNRDVDRLLVTLFQNPVAVLSNNNISSGTGTTSSMPRQPPELLVTLKTHAKLKFSTRRSELREQTSAALKSRNLVSRMDELRSLPQVLTQMVQRQREKQQQLIVSHGKNLILKNKRQSCLNLLQKPPQTPIFPSLIEHKQQHVFKRKQLFDASEEAAVRNAVNRWQTRRQKQQEEARRTYHQCQWLLVSTLAQSAVKWFDAFHDWKVRRDGIRQVTSAKKIQNFWRTQVKARRNSVLGFRYSAHTSRKSPFYRMPVVMKAIQLLQSSMRRWVQRKQNKHKVVAIAIIVTSWFEFQDVKFRRLILRFRKRVRDFQIMWRTWHAITDARIKLLLHVWTKLEKKSKRRHGILNAHNHHRPQAAGSTLVHSLQASEAAAVSPERHQKHLEGLHRHLKNGGTIQTPISATSASLGNNSNTPSIASISRVLTRGLSLHARRQHNISSKVKHDLEFRHQMEEDLQHAMQDFYTTANTNLHNANDPKLKHMHPPLALFSSLHPARGKHITSPAPSSSWKALAGAVMIPPSSHTEKVPLHLKVSMLRTLLSEKRKAFQVTKDRKREEWRSRRQQMRRMEFRYNVLDELAAYQKFQAENSVFLLLHSVSETEMLHVMHCAQQMAS